MNLLPCPFCGGTNLSCDNLGEGDDWSVECEDCKVQQQCIHKSEAAATAAWNQRGNGLAPVLFEIERAMAKFPTWPTDALHALAVLGEEYGELNKAVLQGVYEPHKQEPTAVRKEAVQTAAMALRFLMSVGEYTTERCLQHTQAALAAHDAARKERK